MLDVVLSEGGLYLPELDLHLDAQVTGARATFVSHAHADHGGEGTGGVVLASPETLALLAARGRDPAAPSRPLEWNGAIDWPLASGGAARLSIAPAGHVLGAAQLVVDHRGERFVYTGDYRSGPGATSMAGAPVPCDQLVIESTYGLPIFSFPPRERVWADVVTFCEQALAAGRTPALLGYALGTAQEAASHLLAAGLPIVAHGAVYKVSRAYEALGVPLGVADGRMRAYAEEAGDRHHATTPPVGDLQGSPRRQGKRKGLDPGLVLLLPPRAAASMLRGRGDAVAVGFVSGNALLDAAVERSRADAGFPVSNHADFDDLVATVRASSPREVVVTHGDAPKVFARLLEAAGFRARALSRGPIDARAEEA